MKFGRTIATFYSKPPYVRPIDILTCLLIRLNVVKVLDSIDILDSKDDSKVGQYLWVSGEKSLLDFLAKKSDYKGPGVPVTLYCTDDEICDIKEGQE